MQGRFQSFSALGLYSSVSNICTEYTDHKILESTFLETMGIRASLFLGGYKSLLCVLTLYADICTIIDTRLWDGTSMFGKQLY